MNHRRIIFMLAASIATLEFAAPGFSVSRASAEEGESLPPTTEFFETHDQNADGTVTQDEFSGSGEVFRLLDKDKDGAITGPDLGLPVDYKPDPRAVERAKKRARGMAPENGTGSGRRNAPSSILQAITKMDADGDGKVSKDEWKFRPQGFDRLDRNRDGFIDKRELKRAGGAGAGGAARRMAQAKKQFQRLDANGDGGIDAEEAPYPGLLKRFDTDGDGKVTMEEFAKRRQRGNNRGKAQGKAKNNSAKRKAKRRGLSQGMLRRFDSDADGKVTLDEYPASPERFGELDADGDGFLTEKDIAAAAPKKDDATKGAPSSDFAALDGDGDGRLHRGEFKGTDKEWTALDANQDGWLTPEELAKGASTPDSPAPAPSK